MKKLLALLAVSLMMCMVLAVGVFAYTPDHIILDFGNPAVVSAVKGNMIDWNEETAIEAKIVKADEADGTLGGAYAHIEKLNDSIDGISLYLEEDLLPQGLKWKDYPVVVIRSRESHPGTTKWYRYWPTGGTDYKSFLHNDVDIGYFTGGIPDNRGGGTEDWITEDGEWITHARPLADACGEDGICKFEVRFMLGGETGGEGEWVDIDYIGFFKDYGAFWDFWGKGNPHDGEEINPDDYADAIAAVNALDGHKELRSDVAARYNLNATHPWGPLYDAESPGVKEWIKDLVADALGYEYTHGENYSIAFKKHITSADDRNAYTTFSVVFGNDFTNGYFVESDEIMVQMTGAAITSEMLGAQLRADGERAIRFGTKVFVDSAIANSVIKQNTNKVSEIGIAAEGKTITFGTLIAPKEALIAHGDYIVTATVNKSSFNGDATELAHKNLTQDDDKWFMQGYQVADVEANYVYDSDDNSFTYTAVVKNIPENADSITLVARAYAKIVDDATSEVTYVYSNPIERCYDLVNNNWSEKSVYDNACYN